ncbi:uncharacterized protein [Dysidea avara]
MSQDESNEVSYTEEATNTHLDKKCSVISQNVTKKITWTIILMIIFLLLLLLMINSTSLLKVIYPTTLDYIKIDHTNRISRDYFSFEYLASAWTLSSDIVAPVILRFSNFSEEIIKNELWDIVPFFAFKQGYLMGLKIDIHDDDLCVLFYLMKGPYDDELHWPLNGTFIIELLNQRGDYGHHKKAFLLNDEICTDCTSRPGRNGMSAYGINLISLKALIENTQFYENDNMLLRISYTSCYWCVYLEDATMALVGCVVVSVLDCLCSLVFLAFVVLWKDAQQTLTDFYLALINLVYQHHVIKNAFKSFLCLILLTIMKTMVDIILEQYFGVFTYYHTGFIIWCFVERIAKVYLYLSIANVYSRQCIIVRPFWLLLAFIQTHGPMATAIMVLTVTITNIFAVIAYDML